jgi:hypothetical protein
VHGEPKVAEPEDVVVADEDVLGLDVTVDDVGVVHPLGSVQQLPHGGAHRGSGLRRVEGSLRWLAGQPCHGGG